jgi:hypothetical protein
MKSAAQNNTTIQRLRYMERPQTQKNPFPRSSVIGLPISK